MTQIPAQLFRGDRDPKNARKLQQYWNTGWLQTNLGDHGSGADIFRAPLKTLVEMHVNATWLKTHFLSFSSDRVVAESFAEGETGGRLAALPDDAEHWDTSLFTFDTQRLQRVQLVSPGVFVALFAHEPQAFATGLSFVEALGLYIQDQNYRDHDIPVVLIDSMAALEAVEPKTPAILGAIEKAKWDHEWLLLPADPFSDSGSSRVELTALLDASCVSRKEKFRIDVPTT